MIIHLESGACRSGIDAMDLNRWTAQCYQWRYYVDPDYREDLLGDVDIQFEYGTSYPFSCPTCDREFTRLSGLFQHVTTQSCEQELDGNVIGKLCWWLEVSRM